MRIIRGMSNMKTIFWKDFERPSTLFAVLISIVFSVSVFMDSTIQHFKIFRSIIPLDTVLVMDVFPPMKFPAQLLLHDVSVLPNSLSIYPNKFISSFGNGSRSRRTLLEFERIAVDTPTVVVLSTVAPSLRNRIALGDTADRSSRPSWILEWREVSHV